MTSIVILFVSVLLVSQVLRLWWQIPPDAETILLDAERRLLRDTLAYDTSIRHAREIAGMFVSTKLVALGRFRWLTMAAAVLVSAAAAWAVTSDQLGAVLGPWAFAVLLLIQSGSGPMKLARDIRVVNAVRARIVQQLFEADKVDVGVRDPFGPFILGYYMSITPATVPKTHKGRSLLDRVLLAPVLGNYDQQNVIDLALNDLVADGLLVRGPVAFSGNHAYALTADGAAYAEVTCTRSRYADRIGGRIS